MITDDQARILLSMVACIPLSYAIPKIPNTFARELYSFVLGTFIQFYIYGKDILLIFALHALIYAMVKVNPKHCGKHVTIVSLVLLSIYHIYRLIVDYGGWTMDISTIMMCNVNKYSLFAYAYQDGRTDLHKLSKQQIKQRLETLPTFFRFLSYCQFLPGAPISTPFAFKDYEHYMELRHQYENIPSPWKAVGYDLGYAVIMMLFYLIHALVFPLYVMQEPGFPEKGFWYIALYSFISITLIRFKYYFAWKLSMGALHASGVTYQTHGNGTSDFKLIQTCNPYKVETTPHVRQKIANWNMTVQEWLRKCVYERSHFKNKIYSQLLTFMVSAFWHGYYGGYYISFFLWFCQVFVSQLVFKQGKKEKSPWVRVYKATQPFGYYFIWLVSNMAFSISAIYFQVLSLSQSISIIRALYYAPFIFYFSVYLLFTFGATRERRPKNEVTQQDHGHKKHQQHDKNKIVQSQKPHTHTGDHKTQ